MIYFERALAENIATGFDRERLATMLDHTRLALKETEK